MILNLKSSLTLCSILLQIWINGAEAERGYHVEAYRKNSDPSAVILQLKPVEVRGGRQVDEDEEEDVPNTTPFIPQIIPGLTKIFNGIVTGNLNEIFHGSTSFAPRNVSHSIDTVYNTVVGIPPPRTTVPTTPPPVVANATVASVAATTPATDDDDEDESEPDQDLGSRVRPGQRRADLIG